MIHIEIKHLKLIKTVAETGNLTRAAQRLYVSQPALSRQLMDIEDRLGTPLFHRSKKRMALTPAGSRMLQSAEAVLQELETAELDIAKMLHGETGSLRIGVSCLFCFQWLPSVMAEFQEFYPRVDLSISTSHSCAEELTDKAFDMVITAMPVISETLESVELFKDEMVAIMAPDHPLSSKRFLAPTDMAATKLIVSAALPLDHLRQAVWQGEPIQSGAIMQIEQPHAIVELVKAGIGISLAPRWAVRSCLSTGTLSAIPLNAEGLFPTWKVAYLKVGNLPLFWRKFIDLLLKLNIRGDKLWQIV